MVQSSDFLGKGICTVDKLITLIYSYTQALMFHQIGAWWWKSRETLPLREMFFSILLAWRGDNWCRRGGEGGDGLFILLQNIKHLPPHQQHNNTSLEYSRQHNNLLKGLINKPTALL
jgi:hypothetical protein